MEFIIESLLTPLGFFSDPNRRLYWVYLLFSLFVFLFFVFKKNIYCEIKSKAMLNKDSLWLDVKLWLFNSVIRSFVGLFAFISLSATVLLFVKFLYIMLPHWSPLQINYTIVTVFLTFVSFVVFDFLRFFQHYLMHKVSFLWHFHQVHHSATYLTPITLYRMHPVENLISAFRRIGGQTFVFGSFMFIFGSSVNVYDIIGVNAISFVANFALSNLRHSPLPISFGLLEKVFISPAQHQLHHSSNPKLTHSNYGVVLSLWDKLWGTLVLYNKQDIKYGVKNLHLQNQGFYHQLITPFSLCLQQYKSFAPNLKSFIRYPFNLIAKTGENIHEV
ncbi:MAG: sterol desaturase family protein [Bdellovibrionales bacterium]|nr:sterol desaturase family protein [Bdellovibrionales bacterium]